MREDFIVLTRRQQFLLLKMQSTVSIIAFYISMFLININISFYSKKMSYNHINILDLF